MWHVMLSWNSSHIQIMPLILTPTRLISMLILSFVVWNVYHRIRLKTNRYGNWTQKGKHLPSQLYDPLTHYSSAPIGIQKQIGGIIFAKRALVVCSIMPTRWSHDLVTGQLAHMRIHVISSVKQIESYDASRCLKYDCGIIVGC